MLTLASAWYESWSFWQFAITTLVAVAVGAVAAFATLRAANPKRRLDWETGYSVPLLITPQTGAGVLELTHNGVPVAHPRIVELRLRNSGRRDITQAQFHGNASLTFDLGSRVVGVLGMTSSPAGAIPPVVTLTPSARPSVVEIPPSLLARKQVFEVTVLLDGQHEEARCTAAPLIDVTVRRHSFTQAPGWRLLASSIASGSGALVAGVILALTLNQ
ncbi:hypothetical protein OG728_31935 [Streptomyces microflavus]|uniref:hypothetical protein n=1 Tax=Streptomyces microflavus TaxID=1919 RepID=UPI002E12A600|nr:hypothetical protein OG728_31935 [Streptomyces microflavus]